jgi:hypothetical protein
MMMQQPIKRKQPGAGKGTGKGGLLHDIPLEYCLARVLDASTEERAAAIIGYANRIRPQPLPDMVPFTPTTPPMMPDDATITSQPLPMNPDDATTSQPLPMKKRPRKSSPKKAPSPPVNRYPYPIDQPTF